MKNGFRIWGIVYPLALYYTIAAIVYYALSAIIGTGGETYMLRQTIGTAVTIPFLLRFYREDVPERGKSLKNRPGGKAGENGEDVRQSNMVRDGVLGVLIMIFLGFFVNNILVMCRLTEYSAAFAEAEESFFGGSVFFELLGSCLVIPIAEELLFRGILYGRIKGIFRFRLPEKGDEYRTVVVPAIICSALLFGVVHANLVQFLYATILGLFLAFLMERTGHVSFCMAGHIAANLLAVWRENTGVFVFSYEPTPVGIAVTMLAGAGAAGLIIWMVKSAMKK